MKMICERIIPEELQIWEVQQVNHNQNRDIPFWQALATQTGGTILELGCGTGRITLPLADAGHRIIGLDNNNAALQLLKESGEEVPLLIPVCADMSSFQLQEKVRLCIAGYSAFQHLLTLEEQEACLRTVHKHLEPDGILALDINPAVLEGADSPEHQRMYELIHIGLDATVTLDSSWESDFLMNVRSWDDVYRISERDSAEYEFRQTIQLKACSLDYLRLLLPGCGFEIIRVVADFENETLTPNLSNLIVISRKT